MVYFVGAGSGAPDLITVRGQRLLREADVIIYAGSLVNPALLEEAKENCEIYNSAYMNLEQVIRVMETAEEEGQMTVRLHTGDPSIFGAVREQIDALKERRIPYEVCPGVSSFCGAAAALQAEYTLPGVSQTVIITRMEGRTPVPDKEKLKDLAKHRATLILFLSAGLTGQVQKELLCEGGYSEDTPAALVYKATWPEEKVVRGVLGQLNQLAQQNDIRKTALIVVGDCLGNDYELSKLYDASFSTGFRKGTE
ncbi:precorrin-4 C(11)-methyltransferase [Anaerolentibacter hominis]|uniref:precorrin-4 C(11)-methyltransferase n=1 Tax=Anaerolentibacter hominis TaxID=3079009 RepID=UPI0031B7F1FE